MTHLLRSFLFCLLVACLANLSSCINDPEPKPTKELDIGGKTELGSLTLGASGGTLELKDVAPVGLKITIPPNAYPSGTTIHLNGSPITGNKFGDDITPLTSLLDYDASGLFAAASVTIEVPIDVGTDKFAMGFYYDRVTRELEGIPVSVVDKNQITLILRKPGEFFISSIAKDKLGGSQTSGFQPGKDDWDFVNEGTARTGGGQSAGMTLSALWYYYNETSKGQPHLWGRFNSPLDDPPKMWYDNAEGIWFATQTELDFDWPKKGNAITAGVNRGINSFTRNALAYAIRVTGKPQLVSLTNNGSDNFPFIVYKTEEPAILLADPSFQAKTNRRMSIPDVKPGGYSSAFSTLAADHMDYKHFQYCAYLGASALIDFDKIAQSRKAAETYNSQPFPAKVNITPLGGEMLTVRGKQYTLADSVKITCDDSTARLYYKGQFSGLAVGLTIRLSEGDNFLGILLTAPGPYAGTMLWKTWRSYNISHSASVLLVPVKDTGSIREDLKFIVKTILPKTTKLEYDWSSGDGREFPETESDTFNIAYDQAGRYNVSVRVKRASDRAIVGVDTLTAIVRPPQVSIIPIKDTGYVGTELRFIGKTLYLPVGNVLYEWAAPSAQLLNGNTDDTLKLTYVKAGIYPISLKLIDTKSNKELSSASANAVTLIPTLTIGSSGSPYVGSTLSCSVNYASQLIPIEYQWSGGDGKQIFTTTSNSQTFFYINTGSYTISVQVKNKVTGELLGSASSLLEIQLYPYLIYPPSPRLLVGPVEFGVEKRHTATYPLRYEWDYGDGFRETRIDESNVSHTYSSAGVYTAKVAIYENITNVLQGIAENTITIASANLTPPTLSQLQSMKLVTIEHVGQMRYQNAGSDSRSIGIAGGDRVALSWDSLRCNTLYSHIWWSQGGGATRREEDTVFVQSELSPDLSVIRFALGRYKSLSAYSFRNEYSDNSNTVKSLSFKEIPLYDVQPNMIRYRLYPPKAIPNATVIYDLSDYSINNSSWGDRYVETEWYSPATTSYIQIIFSK